MLAVIAALLVCCALLAGGCGSSGSSSSSSATTAASTAPTGTTVADPGTIEGDVLKQLPTAPEPKGAAPTLASASASDERTYLREVFNDAQQLWRDGLSSSNQTYTPAKLTIFSQAVQSGARRPTSAPSTVPPTTAYISTCTSSRPSPSASGWAGSRRLT